MDKKEFVLATLSKAEGQPLTPVQMQKLFFVLDREIPDLTGGPHFNFKPFDYGPFDKDVYNVSRLLASEGKMHISEAPHKNWEQFSLTKEGLDEAKKLWQQLPDKAKNYISEVVEFVQKLSFTQLVTAIYKAYPDMKQNSVFKE